MDEGIWLGSAIPDRCADWQISRVDANPRTRRTRLRCDPSLHVRAGSGVDEGAGRLEIAESERTTFRESFAIFHHPKADIDVAHTRIPKAPDAPRQTQGIPGLKGFLQQLVNMCKVLHISTQPSTLKRYFSYLFSLDFSGGGTHLS